MIEVLQFSANFCAPCHALSRQLRGKELTKININKTPEIAEKYNIRSAPILLFLKDGIEVYRHKGILTAEEFDTILDGITLQ